MIMENIRKNPKIKTKIHTQSCYKESLVEESLFLEYIEMSFFV